MSQAQILRAHDPRFAAVEAYLSKHTASQGLNVRYVRSADELLLEPMERA
jgi:hypothetical protein